MKNKLSEFFSRLRERISGEPLTPEETEFKQALEKNVKYVKENIERIAFNYTVDYLEHRQSCRIGEVENILENRGVEHGQPGYEEKFNALFEEKFRNAWEPYKMSKTDASLNPRKDKDDFEPEI